MTKKFPVFSTNLITFDRLLRSSLDKPSYKEVKPKLLKALGNNKYCSMYCCKSYDGQDVVIYFNPNHATEPLRLAYKTDNVSWLVKPDNAYLTTVAIIVGLKTQYAGILYRHELGNYYAAYKIDVSKCY